jgi:hypothetical protein
MKYRLIVANLLLAFLLTVLWSAAVCETSCVLPRDAHGCCRRAWMAQARVSRDWKGAHNRCER